MNNKKIVDMKEFSIFISIVNRFQTLFFISVLLCIAQISWTTHSNNLHSVEDTIYKNRLYAVAGIESASYVTGLSILGFVWYKDHERVPFHFYDDSKGYLQMDKAGHTFSAYYESLISYHAFRWAGMDKSKSVIFAGLAGFLFQLPIEIFDGLYEGWGFSFSDVVANTAGSLLFASQQLIFDDQLIRMKFSYFPSGYPKYHAILGETEFESFFLDYNAHTHWLSANIRGLTGSTKIPAWLNVAIGYSANGMIKEFENPKYYKGQPFPELPRYRQLFLSIDLDWTKIPTDKKWLKQIFQIMNVIKIPFPALEWNGLGELKLRPLYF
jgi:hypothetical protein